MTRIILTTFPTVPAQRLLEFLASSGGLQNILHASGLSGLATNIPDDIIDEEIDETDMDEEDEDYMGDFRARLRRRRPTQTNQFPKVPSDEGTELMREGQFGTDPYFVDRLKKRKGVFAEELMWRELGMDSYGVRKRANQALSQVRWKLIDLVGVMLANQSCAVLENDTRIPGR